MRETAKLSTQDIDIDYLIHDGGLDLVQLFMIDAQNNKVELNEGEQEQLTVEIAALRAAKAIADKLLGDVFIMDNATHESILRDVLEGQRTQKDKKLSVEGKNKQVLMEDRIEIELRCLLVQLGFTYGLDWADRVTQELKLKSHRLIGANYGLSIDYAVKYGHKNNISDLIQAGNEGLIHAVANFNPRTAGLKEPYQDQLLHFSTYASWAIKRKMWRDLWNKNLILIPENKKQDLGLIFSAMRERCIYKLATEVSEQEIGEISFIVGKSVQWVRNRLVIIARTQLLDDISVADDESDEEGTIIENMPGNPNTEAYYIELFSMIDKLPNPYRDILTLRFTGHTLEETTALTGSPSPQTVSNRQNVGLRMILLDNFLYEAGATKAISPTESLVLYLRFVKVLRVFQTGVEMNLEGTRKEIEEQVKEIEKAALRKLTIFAEGQLAMELDKSH